MSPDETWMKCDTVRPAPSNDPVKGIPAEPIIGATHPLRSISSMSLKCLSARVSLSPMAQRSSAGGQEIGGFFGSAAAGKGVHHESPAGPFPGQNGIATTDRMNPCVSDVAPGQTR